MIGLETEIAQVLREMCLVPDRRIRLVVDFAVQAGFVFAVAVPVADDRQVAFASHLEHPIMRVQLAVVVGIDQPLAGSINADLIDAVAAEVADDGDIARLTEFDDRVAFRPAAVAIQVELPRTVPEDADRMGRRAF